MGAVLYLHGSDASGEHSLSQFRSALIADEALGQVAQAVGRMAEATAATVELSQLGSKLLLLLGVLERDTSIEAAVDGLYEAARHVACGGSEGEDIRAERLQRLGEAYMMLRSRVFAARLRPLEAEEPC